MGFIKYSVGKITSLEDKNEVLAVDQKNSMADAMSDVVVCPKCGLQLATLSEDYSVTCFCGHTIKLN